LEEITDKKKMQQRGYTVKHKTTEQEREEARCLQANSANASSEGVEGERGGD
jgi:hypothetical protein